MTLLEAFVLDLIDGLMGPKGLVVLALVVFCAALRIASRPDREDVLSELRRVLGAGR